MKVVQLWCGHERRAPFDWNGRDPLTCRECVDFNRDVEPPLKVVVSSTPDLDRASGEQTP